jgi:DNA polymerase I-like protein with 3'-5' exonuclease and polymerase domains
VIYGAGGEKLAQTIAGGMTKQQGTQLKNDIVTALGPRYSNPWSKDGDRWYRAYPDLGDGFVQRCRKTVKSRGFLRTVGRRIQRIDPDKAYVGPNAIIQGSAADIMKEGLVRAHKALKQYDGHLLLVVHDELVAEVPSAHAEAALSAMRDAMQSAADLVPDGALTLATSGCICDSYDQAKD